MVPPGANYASEEAGVEVGVASVEGIEGESLVFCHIDLQLQSMISQVILLTIV